MIAIEIVRTYTVKGARTRVGYFTKNELNLHLVKAVGSPQPVEPWLLLGDEGDVIASGKTRAEVARVAEKQVTLATLQRDSRWEQARNTLPSLRNQRRRRAPIAQATRRRRRPRPEPAPAPEATLDWIRIDPSADEVTAYLETIGINECYETTYVCTECGAVADEDDVICAVCDGILTAQTVAV